MRFPTGPACAADSVVSYGPLSMPSEGRAGIAEALHASILTQHSLPASKESPVPSGGSSPVRDRASSHSVGRKVAHFHSSTDSEGSFAAQPDGTEDPHVILPARSPETSVVPLNPHPTCPQGKRLSFVATRWAQVKCPQKSSEGLIPESLARSISEELSPPAAYSRCAAMRKSGSTGVSVPGSWDRGCSDTR